MHLRLKILSGMPVSKNTTRVWTRTGLNWKYKKDCPVLKKNVIFLPYSLQMKTLLFFYMLCLSSGLLAQDTIFLNSQWEESLPQEAAYYRIDKKVSSGRADLEQSTYFIIGQIKSLRSFDTRNDKKVLEGDQSTWYSNGQLWYTENYRKGERDGELLAFWEDGSKRRRDVYKKGKLITGRTWNEKGEEVAHFPVMVPASFPGGQKALAAYLRKMLPVPDSQKEGTEVRLLVSITINKNGHLNKIELVEGAPHWYNAMAISALSRMPRWNPGKFMGEPVRVRYALPVIFRK